jgi:zinc protease
MRSLRLLLAGLAAWACAGPPVPDRPLLPEQRLPQRLFQLGSGLRVLVQEDHAAPQVAVVAVHGVGSGADPAGQEGLAHLVGHLFFRSQAGGGRPMIERLRQTGASFNAHIELDHTTYHALAHRDQLGELLEIERRRLAQPLEGITPEVFAVERDNIRTEGRRAKANPEALVDLLELAFPRGHQLVRHLSIEDASYYALTFPAAQELVRAHYRPENCTIVVAGDVSPEAVGEIVGRWGPEIVSGPQGGEGPARQPRGPVRHEPRPLFEARLKDLARRRAPVSSPRLLLGWPVPAGAVAGDPLLPAVLGVLQLGMGDAWIGDFRGSVFASEPQVVRGGEGALLLFDVALAEGEEPRKRLRELVRRLPGRIDSTAMSLIGKWLGVYKWFASTELLRQSTNLLASARWLARHLATTGRPYFFTDALKGLSDLNGPELADFFETYITPARTVALVLEPDGWGPAPGDPAGPVVSGPEVTWHDVLDRTAPVNLAGRGAGDIRRIAPSPGLASLPRFRFENGLEVVALVRPRAPVTEIALRLAASDHTLAPFGLASLATRLSRGRCVEADRLQAVGGKMFWRTDESGSHHAVEVLSGNLPNGLLALANEVRCRRLVSNVTAARDAYLQHLAAANSQPANRVFDEAEAAFWSALYPNQAFGPPAPRVALLQQSDELALEAALRAQYQPAGALAVVVTDRPPDDLRGQLARYLGPWTGSAPLPVRKAPSAPDPPAGRSLRLFHGGTGTRATVRLGCRLPPVSEASWPAYRVLANIVNSEVWEERDSLGASYGFESSVTAGARGVAHLVISGTTDASRAGETVAHLVGLLDRIAQQGPPMRRFINERWDVARWFARHFATTSGISDAILEAADLGLAPEAWDRYPENLAGLQRSHLRDLLAPCRGRESITVLGDRPEITRQLATHGLSPSP